MKRGIHQRRPGFTLTEMLAVMATLPIVIGFGGLMLLLAMRASTTAAGTLRSLVARSHLADRFRADVGQATAAPESWRDWTQSPTCLILQMPDDAPVVYHITDTSVERLHIRGESTVRTTFRAGGAHAIAEFEMAAAEDRRVAVLRLGEQRFHNRIWEVEVAAPLGGDRR
jgi:prepilin-type N-terminal cleavage/methylation domain-containing protein